MSENNENDNLIEFFSMSDYKSQGDLYKALLEDFKSVLVRDSNSISIGASGSFNGKIVPLMVNQIMYGSIFIGKVNQNIPDDILQYVDDMLSNIKSIRELQLNSGYQNSPGYDRAREIRNCFEHCNFRIMIDPGKITNPKITYKSSVIPEFKENEEFLYIRLEGNKINGDISFSDFQRMLEIYSLLNAYNKGVISKETLKNVVEKIGDYDKEIKVEDVIKSPYSNEKKEEIDRKTKDQVMKELFGPKAKQKLENKGLERILPVIDPQFEVVRELLQNGSKSLAEDDERNYPFNANNQDKLNIELGLLKEFQRYANGDYGNNTITNKFNQILIDEAKLFDYGGDVDYNLLSDKSILSDRSLFLYLDTLLSYSAFTLYYMREKCNEIPKNNPDNKEPLIPKNVSLKGVNARRIGDNGEESTYFPNSVIDNELLIAIRDQALEIIDGVNKLIGKSIVRSQEEIDKIDEENLYKLNLLSLGYLLESGKQVVSIEDEDGVKKDYDIKAEDFAFIMDRDLIIQEKRLKLPPKDDKEYEDPKYDKIKLDIEKLSWEISERLCEFFKNKDLESFTNKPRAEKMKMFDSFVSQIESKYREISIPNVVENIAIITKVHEMLNAINNDKNNNETKFTISNNKDGKDRKLIGLVINKNDYKKLIEEALSGGISELENQNWILNKIFNPPDSNDKAKINSLQIEDSEKEVFVKDLIKQILESQIEVKNERVKVSDYIELIKAVQEGKEPEEAGRLTFYDIPIKKDVKEDGNVIVPKGNLAVNLKIEDISKILESIMAGKKEDAILYVLSSGKIFENNNELSADVKYNLSDKLINKVVSDAMKNIKTIRDSKDTEKISQILPAFATLFEEKNKVKDSNELFRHMRNAFAHGRIKMDFSHVIEEEKDYLRTNPKNIIFFFTDRDDSKGKDNFKVTMTAESYRRLLNNYVESIDKQIEDRRNLGKVLVTEDKRRKRIDDKLYNQTLSFARTISAKKCDGIHSTLNRRIKEIKSALISKNKRKYFRKNLRRRKYPLKQRSKNNKFTRAIIRQRRLENKAKMPRKRPTSKDFESLASESDLVRALKLKDFDGLLLSEYLPDNENQDRE